MRAVNSLIARVAPTKADQQMLLNHIMHEIEQRLQLGEDFRSNRMKLGACWEKMF